MQIFLLESYRTANQDGEASELFTKQLTGNSQLPAVFLWKTLACQVFANSAQQKGGSSWSMWKRTFCHSW